MENVGPGAERGWISQSGPGRWQYLRTLISTLNFSANESRGWFPRPTTVPPSTAGAKSPTAHGCLDRPIICGPQCTPTSTSQSGSKKQAIALSRIGVIQEAEHRRTTILGTVVPVHSVILAVRGTNAVIPMVAAIVEMLGGRTVDASSPTGLFNPRTAADPLEQSDRYKAKALASNP